ncbi:hypothetical protein AB0I28_10820 [Phytomonospora sp. NPDC050363]|uniref:hypothetical protein n=1 Tax=Phytomonospora sp. NPDC050363 TaxID=3155642 RepID=UPI003400A847
MTRNKRIPALLLMWALVYGVIRAFFALRGEPGPGGAADLGAFSGRPAVALCVVSAAAGLWQYRRPSRAAALAGGLVAVLLAVAPYRVVLDLFGLAFPGAGMSFSWPGFAARAACLAGAVLLASSTAAALRRVSPDRPGNAPLVRPPRWAWAGAYLVVAAFVVRVCWQVGFDAGPSSVTFAEDPVTGTLTMLPFAAAGLLLPLALVHSWGRVWPRVLPPLAGRRVPRWLVLGPAIAAAVLILAYFVSGTLSLSATALGLIPGDRAGAADILAGTWLADTSYVVWGAGLAVAAVGYHRLTRPPSPSPPTS